MTQADFTVSNQTFPNTRAEINTSLQALATNSAGNSAPSTTFPNQWWFDSDGNKLYIRNKDNDAFVEVLTIGATSDKIETFTSTTINGIPFYQGDTGSIYTHDVSGTDDSAQYNTGYGLTALDAITTGDNNVAIGYSAGTAITTGTSNTAVGYIAGSSINTGSNNTALGNQSLENLTSGSDNAGGGSGALNALTEGSNNTAFGRAALGSNTTASNNTSFGYHAGLGITTGTDNIAIGYQAIDAADTEDNNLAIGKAALGGAVAGGEFNVAIGNESLDALTSGDANTAVGYQSGSALTTGALNTFLGYQSGLGNTEGGQNTFLGRQAGEANTTGNVNIAIGDAAYDAADTESNNLAIGNAAMGGAVAGGEFNVAIGNQSLDAVTSGDDNLAAGYNSGTNITSGTDNVAIGKDAMSVVVGGSGNICLGSGADVADGAADFTTAIGFQVGGTAGYTTIGKTTDDIRAAHGNTTWNTVSDERFKKNIETSDAGLAVINDLRPVTYNWKTKGEVPEWSEIYEQGSNEQYKNSKHNHGFIAQEVKAVIDSHSELKDGFNMWDERPDGQQEVGETAIVPILVKAVQELSATVTTLQQEINTLKGE